VARGPKRAFGGVSELIVAATTITIFSWAGASARKPPEFEVKRQVLTGSNRLPRAVWELAGEVSDRSQRDMKSASTDRARGPRRVDHVARGGGPDPRTLAPAGADAAQLVGLADLARLQGVVYAVLGQASGRFRPRRGDSVSTRPRGALALAFRSGTTRSRHPPGYREYMLRACATTHAR